MWFCCGRDYQALRLSCQSDENRARTFDLVRFMINRSSIKSGADLVFLAHSISEGYAAYVLPFTHPAHNADTKHYQEIHLLLSIPPTSSACPIHECTSRVSPRHIHKHSSIIHPSPPSAPHRPLQNHHHLFENVPPFNCILTRNIQGQQRRRRRRRNSSRAPKSRKPIHGIRSSTTTDRPTAHI